MNQDNTQDVYNRLSAPNDDDNYKINQKWTLYLICCCMIASLASFTFGFNIGVINLPTPHVKSFYSNRYFSPYHEGEKEYDMGQMKVKESELEVNNTLSELEKKLEKYTLGNETFTEEQLLDNLNKTRSDVETRKSDLAKKRSELDESKVKVESASGILWVLTASVFVVGGLIGALTSKYVAEFFGRKKGIIFHYSFSIVGAILSLISLYVNSPECVMIGRFLYGVQGGMACGLIPTYLNEISPAKLRGATGVFNQLFLTVGIAVSQILGFRQLLGTPRLWSVLFGIPIITSVLGGVILLLVFPESPVTLIRKYKDEEEAASALKKLRNSKNVDYELDDIRNQISKDVNASKSCSIAELFTTSEYRWPLITGLVLQVTQQFCGINAVFYYSESIFLAANIKQEQIQYAVLLTGVINVLSTIIVVPLIDRLGRRPLLIYPMLFIVVDFIALTLLLVFKEQSQILSYLSIVCIILFIICFAVGLGPIPFIYVAEVFTSEARSTALAICMFTNWLANLIVALSFPYMNELLKSYAFLVFTGIVAVAVVFIIKFVPETKNRQPEQIMASFDSKYARRLEESSGKLMGNTNV